MQMVQWTASTEGGSAAEGVGGGYGLPGSVKLAGDRVPTG
jgi:hypothetical protein